MKNVFVLQIKVLFGLLWSNLVIFIFANSQDTNIYLTVGYDHNLGVFDSS